VRNATTRNKYSFDESASLSKIQCGLTWRNLSQQKDGTSRIRQAVCKRYFTGHGRAVVTMATNKMSDAARKVDG
jgi:hypothetical protein